MPPPRSPRSSRAALPTQGSARLADTGEFGLIESIRRHLEDRLGPARGPASSGTVVGIGDDAAILRPRNGEDLVVTTDIQMAGRHVLPQAMTAAQVGRRALHVTLSDLAAMGAQPEHVFVSLGLLPQMRMADILALYDGFLEALRGTEASIAGGNVTATEGPWFCDLTVLGSVPRGQGLLRSGARAGDRIFVSGTPGSSAAGLQLLTQALQVSGPDAEPATHGATEDLHGFGAARAGISRWQSAHPWSAGLLEAYLEPTARLELGRRLREERLAHAACDLSDGFVGDLGHLCEASHVCAIVEVPRLPVTDTLREAARHCGRHPLSWALGPSDDYELVFTAAPDAVPKLQDLAADLRVDLHCVGSIDVADSPGASGTAKAGAGPVRFVDLPAGLPVPHAWDHFGRR